MDIRFTLEDWARIRETYGKWWNKTLDRPVIKVTLKSDSGYRGTIPYLSQATCTRLDVPAEDIVERLHVELASEEYLGDAFPVINFDSFGPGVAAAFLGAKLDNSSGGVWFFAEEEKELCDMHFEYRSDSIWLERIKDIYRAGQKKWHGNVLMGMPDLGGVYDILASLRGTENLLYDMYDNPDEVKRVADEIQTAWLAFYRDLKSVQEEHPGYSDWSGIYSFEPSYILQCDYSYMIGPEMFGEFVLPGLAGLCRELTHTVYHLDGKGELPHLPQLLAIPELDAVQWVPGEGAPPTRMWKDVYRDIRNGGKNIHLIGGIEDFRAISEDIGSQGIYLNLWAHANNRSYMMDFLRECGVER